MKWEHKCSLKWMKERQKYLCASEIKQLIPFTKTGRVRKITDADRLKVWANKMRRLTEDDCLSFGAAARGHLLEPYAIEEFNTHNEDNIYLYHWDDAIITSKKYLAYSPDAISVPQPSTFVNLKANQFDGGIIIGEIKCYSAEKHIETIYTPNDEREERWQIATAMAVNDRIEEAYLILYHPGLIGFNLNITKYDRYDLTKEIETVLTVEQEWIEFLSNLALVNINAISTDVKEQDIIEIIEREKRLNPLCK